jgi:hypothetical protein
MKNEINSSVNRLKILEQEKLIKETQTKEELKSLMEIEEKVKKDEDRKKKMMDELETLKKNLSKENADKERIEKEIKDV